MFLIIFAVILNVVSTAVKNGLNHEMIAEVFKVSPRSSIAISPLALSLPLYKLAAVSDGPTKTELMTVLGANDRQLNNFYGGELKDSLETLQRTDLLMRNEIYINYTDDLLHSFIENSLNDYGVNVQKVGFASKDAAVDFINKRVSIITFQRITDMLKTTDILKNTTMIILCGLHLKTSWETPFYMKLTTQEYFYSADGKSKVKVPMMMNYDSVLYLEDKVNDLTAEIHDAVTAYNQYTGKVSFNFFVPDTRTGLPALVKKIGENPSFLETTRKNMKYKYVKYSIPKFKVKTLTDWTGFLKKIGVWSIFNCNSKDLNGMKNNKKSSLCLHRAKSSVFVDVDEHGSFRHQETMESDKKKIEFIHMEHGAAPDLVLDRPFYFTVAVHTNDYFAYKNLIHGTYYGPDT